VSAKNCSAKQSAKGSINREEWRAACFLLV
jgi:hypothetical protein